jgi:hypothetical protein
MEYPPTNGSLSIGKHLSNTEPELLDNIVNKQDMYLYDMQQAMKRAEALGRNIEEKDPDPYGYGQSLEQDFSIDILEPEWKAEPDDDRWNKRIKARDRLQKVTKLFRDGHTVSDIAKAVESTEWTIHKDLNSISMSWRKQALEDIEIIVGKDLARLDYYLSRLAPAIERGDVKAIMAATEIVKERGAIMGTRQGVQVDIETYIREVAESNGFDPQKAVDIAMRVKTTLK